MARRAAHHRRRRAKSKRSRRAIQALIPSDIYSRPWWFYENYATTEEQAKKMWLKEYDEGREPIFHEYYERARRK